MNPPRQNALRTPSREGAPSALERIRRAAIRDKKMRFTAAVPLRRRAGHDGCRRGLDAGRRRRGVQQGWDGRPRPSGAAINGHGQVSVASPSPRTERAGLIAHSLVLSCS